MLLINGISLNDGLTGAYDAMTGAVVPDDFGAHGFGLL
jgi:hypothetical protein